MGDVVLSGAGLHHRYGSTPVLRGVDVSVERGEVVAVMGPSGSGKSTLLHLLAGMLRPDSGQVWLAGRRIDTLRDRERSAIRLRQLGFVFQFGDLVPELTVGENVELPLSLLGARAGDVRTRARAMLDQLGVADVAERRLSEVSGGQAQRVAVARALVHEPAVVLADEPTGSLDTVNGELVLDALLAAARQTGSAVMIVTHELRVAARAAREIQLRDGQVVDRVTT